MTLSQHLAAAERAWAKINSEIPKIPSPLQADFRSSLRRDAARLLWLYPPVEARRGKPAV